MADLKTTNIFGDAYINNKVGIATNAPATRLQIGQLSPTAATEGIQFGDDTGTRIYRSSTGALTLNGSVVISAIGLNLSASTALYGNYGDWSGESNKIQWHSNNLYFVNRGGGSWLFRNSSAANVFSIAADGGTSAATNINAGTYVYAGTYLQTNGNLIYPSGYGATQTLQVGNASGNAWIAGLSLAPGGNVTVYNNLTVNNAATVTNDLTVNGNTYLGNANNDTVYVNDTIRIGATDSGDASLFFGEGSVAGSDYGARWYWDSAYTFYWYTRNNGTDTALFDYVTNDTNYINWRRHFHMQNKEINYNAQVHFNAGTRFVGNNTSYLNFRSDSTGAGGILVQDGSATTKGYTGYWDSGGGGILNNTGNWAVRYNFGNANSGGTLYGAWTVNGNISATNLSGTNTGDQTIGNGTITIAAGTGIGVGTSNTFTMNQSGATTVTITNSGVTSAVAGTGISVSGATGAVTISVANGVYTNGNNTFTGTNVQNSPNNTFVNTVTNANQSLTFYQATAGADAYMTFHIGSDFAGYFGLGGAENDLVWGGWSVGNYRYRILHSGNSPYAWNMNQYVRTTDSPTFNTVTANITGNAYNNLSNDYKDIYVYGDVNTYYVVLIQGEYLYSFGRYSVTRGYNWTGPDTWHVATHKGGLTLDWEWSGDTAWGGNDKAIRIIEFNESYSTMVAGLGYPVNGGVIIWLRGGGVNGALYRIRTPVGSNATVTVYDNLSIANHVASTTFTAANSTVFSTRANTDNVSAEILARYPVRGAALLYNENNAVLHAGNYNSYSPTLTGTGASGTWSINVTGNAVTATTLQTARAINGVSFNGSAAITVNGLNYNVNDNWLRENGDDAHFQMYGNSRTMIYRTDGNTNTHGGGAYAHIFYYGGSADANRMFIINTDGRLWSNYHGWLDAMSISGNSATATTLQTARNINGTSFNGSAAITTATWGTARTLTIGSTGKSVDGSAAITWSLAEIGAAATNGASNQNFSANSIYPYEWIRFMVDAGIYWQSGTYAGWHIHPQAAWGMSFRSAGATDCGLQLRRSDATSLGAVYSDGTSIGFLTAAFGWGASFTVAGTMNRGTVPLGRIETITAYTILGNNNASAAAVPSALTPAQVATMLSGQTMNIAGSSTSCTGNSATATSAGCVNSDTGNVGGNRLQYWQTSGNTALNPDGEWYNAIRMGHGDPVTYYSNTLAVRMTGGNLGDIYTRTTTNGATGSWNRFWHNNNDGAGSGLDADLVDGKGLAIAGTADTIVLRDSGGHITGQYILGSYFNASAGNSENPTIGQIWTQNTTDNYLRKSTPAHFRSQVTDGSYPSLTGANASGTWSISITGNAGTATSATTATALSSMNISQFTNNSGYLTSVTNISGNAGTVTNATFYRQFTVRDDRSDGGDYSLAARPTGLYAINAAGTNGPGATYLSLIHVANGSDVAFQIAGGYLSDNMYFRGTYALQNGTGYSAWRTVIHSGNIGSQTVATAGNATTAGGLAVQTGANYDANKIVRTDGNGYILAGWINTISGDNGTTAIDRVYASQDGYIRYYTPANFRTVLDVPTRNGSGVTNFGINTAPSNRLHINGDGTNPAIRVDNGAIDTTTTSGNRSFFGWLPISIGGNTRWIRLFN